MGGLLSSDSPVGAPAVSVGPDPQARRQQPVDLSKLKTGAAHFGLAFGPGSADRRDAQARQSDASGMVQGDWPLTGPWAPGVDRRTVSKLARGQYPIDARIDLHGNRQHQAQDRLERFIISSHQSGHRCLLVITGKGKRLLPGRGVQGESGDPGPGVIRRRFIDWLSAPHLKPLILAIKTAQPKDGGAGAFYILLRRQRPDP